MSLKFDQKLDNVSEKVEALTSGIADHDAKLERTLKVVEQTADEVVTLNDYVDTELQDVHSSLEKVQLRQAADTADWQRQQLSLFQQYTQLQNEFDQHSTKLRNDGERLRSLCNQVDTVLERLDVNNEKRFQLSGLRLDALEKQLSMQGRKLDGIPSHTPRGSDEPLDQQWREVKDAVQGLKLDLNFAQQFVPGQPPAPITSTADPVSTPASMSLDAVYEAKEVNGLGT